MASRALLFDLARATFADREPNSPTLRLADFWQIPTIEVG